MQCIGLFILIVSDGLYQSFTEQYKDIIFALLKNLPDNLKHSTHQKCRLKLFQTALKFAFKPPILFQHHFHTARFRIAAAAFSICRFAQFNLLFRHTKAQQSIFYRQRTIFR